MKKVFAALLIATVALTGCLGGQDKFEKEVQTEASATKLAREVVAGDYGLITVKELKAAMDSGKKMIIVDTMPYDASYAKGHIPTAAQFLFPIPTMKEWDDSLTDRKSQADYEKILGPDKAAPIVVYCGFTKCTRSHNGAIWAKKLGYTNVSRCAGGIFAWKGAEYPAETVK